MDRFAKEQGEDVQLHLLQIYRGELEQLRALVLYEQNQRQIPLDSLDIMAQGLNRIIKGLDRISSLKKVQESVKNAQMSLLIASDILEQSEAMKLRFPNYSKALYRNYAEFADFLLEAIEAIEAIETKVPIYRNLESTTAHTHKSSKDSKIRRVPEEEMEDDAGSVTTNDLSSLNQEESQKGKNQPFTASIEADEPSYDTLSAVARTILEENDKAYVGKTYKVQISISGSISENFRSESLDLPVDLVNTTIAFDILLHVSENVGIAGEWGKHLDYMPSNREPQPVEFEFQVTASGSSFIVADFYRELCWVKTIKLEFDAIKEP